MDIPIKGWDEKRAQRQREQSAVGVMNDSWEKVQDIIRDRDKTIAELRESVDRKDERIAALEQILSSVKELSAWIEGR